MNESDRFTLEMSQEVHHQRTQLFAPAFLQEMASGR
jgi:hypothetical protein